MPTDHEVLRWLYERRPTPNPPPDDDLGDPADFEPIYLATLEEVAEHADSDHDRLSALFLLGEYNGYDPVQNQLVELTATTTSDRVVLIAFRLITRALGGLRRLVRGGGGSPAPRLPGVSPPTPRLPRAPRPRLPALPWPRLPIPRRRRAKKQPQPAVAAAPQPETPATPAEQTPPPIPSIPTTAPSPLIPATDPTPPVPVTRPDDAPPPRKLTKGFLKHFLSNPPKPRSKRKKSRKERKRGKRRRAPPQAAPAAG